MSDRLNDVIRTAAVTIVNGQVKVEFVPVRPEYRADIAHIIADRLSNTLGVTTHIKNIDNVGMVYCTSDNILVDCTPMFVTDKLDELLTYMQERFDAAPTRPLGDILHELRLEEAQLKEKDDHFLPPAGEAVITDAEYKSIFGKSFYDEDSDPDLYLNGELLEPIAPDDQVSAIAITRAQKSFPAVSLRREIVQYLHDKAASSNGWVPALTEAKAQKAARAVINGLMEEYPDGMPVTERCPPRMRSVVNYALIETYPHEETRDHMATQLSAHLHDKLRCGSIERM